MVDTTMARKLWRRLEPYHGFIYFAPEAGLLLQGAGLTPEACYFASRAAAMGAVGPDVVIATFYNFNPTIVRAALPSAWEAATPDEVVSARLEAADQALRRMLGAAIGSPEMSEVASLARKATEGCGPEGRPLYAAHAALGWPESPHLVMWHAVTLLREYRGDGHVAALTLEGLDAVEVLVTHAASADMDLPEVILQTTRAWSDERWAAAKARLRDRGILDEASALTTLGKEQRDRIETLTDKAALAPWVHLGDEDCTRLYELARPFSKAIVASGVFGS